MRDYWKIYIMVGLTSYVHDLHHSQHISKSGQSINLQKEKEKDEISINEISKRSVGCRILSGKEMNVRDVQHVSSESHDRLLRM